MLHVGELTATYIFIDKQNIILISPGDMARTAMKMCFGDEGTQLEASDNTLHSITILIAPNYGNNLYENTLIWVGKINKSKTFTSVTKIH